jgi:hypothetical protein
VTFGYVWTLLGRRCGTIDLGSCIRWVLGFGIKTGYDNDQRHSPHPIGEDLLQHLYAYDGLKYGIQHLEAWTSTNSRHQHRRKEEKEDLHTKSYKAKLERLRSIRVLSGIVIRYDIIKTLVFCAYILTVCMTTWSFAYIRWASGFGVKNWVWQNWYQSHVDCRTQV